MPLTSIIVPCWNGLEYTRQLLESIEAYTPQEHEIILIDNGSTDGTGEFLESYFKEHPEKVKVISNNSNLGFPKACNQGMAAARGEYFCIINTDVIVTPEWLTGLIECMEHRPGVGIVGPMTNNVSGPQVFPQGKYNSLFKMIEFSRNFRASYPKNYVPWYRIVFFCVLISRACYEKVGPLDERFTPGNFEDDDYCLRAILAGFRTYFTHDVFVHHHGGKSHDMTTYQKRLHINQQKFEAKWREWLKKHNRVSVCTIFRDEEKTIEQYLDRNLPMFDEIIMVDTGSVDRSVEIVKAKMKSWPGRLKLFHFEWCNDFSKARNFAQAQATGDFILSLDVDEWIPQFNKGILWPCTAYLIETRNYSELTVFTNWRANAGDYPDQEQGTGWFPSTKARLWPNDPEVFFEMPVHEVADRSIYLRGYRVVKTDIPVHHYGKMCIDYDSQKGERYLKLLEGLIEENANDIRSVEEIATQLQNLKRYEEAIKYWEKYLTLRDAAVHPDHQVYNSYLNIGHCWYNLGDPSKGYEASLKAMNAKPDSREAACNVAVCAFALKKFNEAFEIAKTVLEKHPEYPTAVAVHNAAKEMLERIKQQEET